MGEVRGADGGKVPVMLSNCAGVQYYRPSRIANVGCGDIQWKGGKERGRQRTRTSPTRRLGAGSHRSPSKDRARSAPPNGNRSRSCSLERPWKGPGMSSRIVRMYIRGRPITMVAPIEGVLYDTKEKAQRHYLGHTDDITCLAVHPDGVTVVSGQVGGHRRDIELPHYAKLDPYFSTPGRDNWYKDGGSQLAIANENGGGTMLRLWDWKKKHVLAEAKKLKPKYVECISFTQNGDVITGDSKGNILIFKKDSNQAGRSIIGAHKDGVTALYLRRDGTLISGGGDKKLVLWDLDLQKPLKIAKLPKKTGKVRSICVLDQGGSTVDSNIYVGTTGNCLCEGKIGGDFILTTQGHHSELLTVATHPSQPVFLTSDDLSHVILWNASLRQAVWRTLLKYPAHSADFYPDGKLIAVGSASGRLCVLGAMTGDVIFRRQQASEQLDCLKYSPNGEMLAVGSHENCIYVYTVHNNGRSYKKIGTLRGHSSYVTHLDWDVSSRFLQSTSGDYELLYWDVIGLRHVNHASSMSDVTWATQTCVFGYSVFGMWPEDADGTDINACAASNDRTMLASSDDFGKVNLYRYPCSTPMSPGQIYPGHSSHVTCVRFLYDDSYLLSTGGADSAVFQWRVVSKGAKLHKSARGQPSADDLGVSKLTFINDLLDDIVISGKNQENGSSALPHSPNNERNSTRTRQRNNTKNENQPSAHQPMTPILQTDDQALIDHIFAIN
uniref:HELP domain-containing protein n=1 Tax=Branchiostoma floridae TaxID=7739 RepID=C3YYY1_BRAFL|eukprot:XP_002598477.1 hypothetical protein BRAFLDRAFT_66854 [Branchiostoma floridae]